MPGPLGPESNYCKILDILGIVIWNSDGHTNVDRRIHAYAVFTSQFLNRVKMIKHDLVGCDVHFCQILCKIASICCVKRNGENRIIF